MPLLPLRCLAVFGVVLAVACIRDADLGDGDALEQGSELDAMVAARCDRFFECDCSPLGFDWASSADCESSTQGLVDGWQAFAQEHALVLDEECRQRWLDYYALPGCGPIDADGYALQDAMQDCNIFHGTGALGDVCYSAGFGPRVSTCSAELRCNGLGSSPGVCVEPPGPGDTCGTQGSAVVRCGLGMICVELENESDPHCEPLVPIGEPCEGGFCDFGGTCSGGICEANVINSCDDDSECLRGYCDSATMTCKQPPAACGVYYPDLLDACDDARYQALPFVMENQSCEVDEDCVAVEALCALGTTCGQLSLNSGYDTEQWAAIAAAQDAACSDECGADPCGFAPACNDGVCGFAM